MTLLAYVLDRDRVLLGADTGVAESNGGEGGEGVPPVATFRTHKIHEVDGHPVAWGMTGSLSDATRFARAMTDVPFENWTDVADSVGQAVAELNSNLHRREERARVKKEEIEKHKCMVILAGRIGDRLGVLHTDRTGDTTLLGDHMELPAAGGVGLWLTTFRAASTALFAVRPDADLTDPETFRKFMGGLCFALPGLETPIDIWMATQESGGIVEPESSSTERH